MQPGAIKIAPDGLCIWLIGKALTLPCCVIEQTIRGCNHLIERCLILF
jgi:hypothetical protein